MPYEPDGGQPRPSGESSLVWLVVVIAAIAALVSMAFPLAQGIEASAQVIATRSAVQ